jgi:hypothetical protein
MVEKMTKKMRCCTQCQVYWTCETKWYRGERGEENICCNICNFYEECLDKEKQKKELVEKKK